MKNYFLFSLILIFSLYSVSALYQGTLDVGVGESPNIEVGETPAVIVTEEEDSGGSSGSGGSSDSGGGGGDSSSSGGSFVEVFNQTLEINEDGEIVKSQISNNIEQEQTSQGIFSPITGAVIGLAKKPVALFSMIFLVLALTLALMLLTIKRKR